jgi:2-iminobutanoate/2-iminopropanoate deaminase
MNEQSNQGRRERQERAAPDPRGKLNEMSDVLFHMIAGGPRPVAPFSHAVECDGFIFVTGQMPDTPAHPGVLPEGIEAQTRKVMANLATVLSGIGLGLRHVTAARAFLTHFYEDYEAFNAVIEPISPTIGCRRAPASA